jgi:hypothetical protein
VRDCEHYTRHNRLGFDRLLERAAS